MLQELLGLRICFAARSGMPWSAVSINLKAPTGPQALPSVIEADVIAQ
jgi:hypothetical protein